MQVKESPSESETGFGTNLSGTALDVRSIEVTAYSGPLPHPAILEQFERIYPGAAKAIVDDFLVQSKHRRAVEWSIVRSVNASDIGGTMTACLIGLLGVGGGLWLAHEGKALGGLSAFFGTLATLVGAFLYQNRKPAIKGDHTHGQASDRHLP